MAAGDGTLTKSCASRMRRVERKLRPIGQLAPNLALGLLDAGSIAMTEKLA
jgi:hypothetical protein